MKSIVIDNGDNPSLMNLPNIGIFFLIESRPCFSLTKIEMFLLVYLVLIPIDKVEKYKEIRRNFEVLINNRKFVLL